MQLSKGLVRLAMLGVALVCLVGCGERLYRVKGTVTFEGKALPGGGSISFVPQGTEKVREAGGVIKEDGTFELTTNHPGDGAMAGDYRVIIRQTAEIEPENVGDNGKAAPRKSLSLPANERIPAKYADPYNSPLKAKVEAKSPNEISFQLTRK